MINLTLAIGATSQIIPFSVFDSSSTVGAKLAGLVYNSSSLTAYYNRTGVTGSAVAISLVTATKGTWTSSGFIAVDGTNMPGDYELHIPNAALASGVDSLLIQIKGATNMVPVNIFIELVAEIELGSDNKVEVSADAHTSGQTIAAMTGNTAQTADNNVLAAGVDGFEAISSKIDNIGASSGGSVNIEATSDNTGGAIIDSVVFVGTVTSGTFGSLEAKDGVTHDIDDDTDVIDIVYGFAVGGNRQATSVKVVANVNGNNDEMLVKVYDHVGAGWDTLDTITGTGGALFFTVTPELLSKHTGTGAELGNVYIRLDTDSTTPSDIIIDQILIQAVNIGQSVGYALGRVWVDTVGGASGVVPFFNGVADKSTDLMTSAFTIAGDVGLSDFSIINGSAIVLGSSVVNKSFFGDHWTLDLNGQACGGLYCQGATVSGAGTSSGEEMHFEGCDIGTATVEQAHFDKCGFTGTVTLNTADSYDLHGCYSKGSAVPVFTKTAGQTIVFETHAYSGDITLNGIQAGDEVELSGTFRTITINGTGGTVHVHGDYETLAGTLAPTLVVGVKQGYSGGAVVIDTNNGDSGSVVNVHGTEENPVDNFADAVLIAAGMNPLPLKHFHQRKGSSITLVSDFTAFLFNGIGGTVALGGRTLNLCTFLASNLTGVVNAATTGRIFVEDCLLTGVTMTDAAIEGSSFLGTFTVNDTGAYSIMNGSPQDTSNPPTFDMGAAVANTNLELLKWNGPVIISNLGASGTDTLYITGSGQITLDNTCTSGTLVYAGDFTLTNNGTTSAITHIGGATEDKQDIINANVDQLETAIITNAAGVDVAADIAALKVVADAIPTTAMRGTDSAATEAKQDIIDSNVDALAVSVGNLNDFDPATEEVDADIKKINSVTITGDGSATPFGV